MVQCRAGISVQPIEVQSPRTDTVLQIFFDGENPVASKWGATLGGGL